MILQLRAHPIEQIEWDQPLISKYDKAGPRYTSYPTAVQFHEEFNEQHYKEICKDSNQQRRPLSLYFHIPFCDTVCYYCACNKIVTANKKHAREYLDLLKQEITRQAELFTEQRPVSQLHWGGGTPTFLSMAEMTELMHHTARYFHLLEDDRGEYSIEIDPRSVNAESISLLRGLGFNRISLGVQDFDPDVQKAVNRVQSFEMVQEIVEQIRFHEYKSLSFDVIYGLPKQTIESVNETIDKVIQLSPDRISVFNYAHMPQRFKVQRQINEAELPSASEKLEILHSVITKLTKAGYSYIGMDHFAKPEDPLSKAQQEGTLQRNFQGYSTHKDADLVGMGISAISAVGNSFSQNVRTMAEYRESINDGNLAVQRGFDLSQDDLIRQEVIMQLICHNWLDIHAIEKRFDISFANYFSKELEQLKAAESDGLIDIRENMLQITSRGRLLVRSLCMLFDAYLDYQLPQAMYSRII